MKRIRSFYTLICAIALMILSTISVSAAEEFPYVIDPKVTYWESSWNFGSGRHAVVSIDNPYTTAPCYAAIDGFSFLGEDGHVILSDYDESQNDIAIPVAPEGAARLMKHFRSYEHRNGWVYAEDVRSRKGPIPVTTPEPSKDLKQTPKEIISKISEDISNRKTAIIIDVSGSMESNQREVVSLLDTLQFNDNTKIFTFADTVKEIDEARLSRLRTGGKTHLMAALNKADESGVEHIILISDLATFDDVKLKEAKNVKSMTIYNPKYRDLICSEKNGEVTFDDVTSSTKDRELWAEYFVKEILQPQWPGVSIKQIEISD